MITSASREEGLPALVSGGFMGSLASGTMVKSRCEAKLTRRRTRRGYRGRFFSRVVGGLIERVAISCRQRLMKPSTSSVCSL